MHSWRVSLATWTVAGRRRASSDRDCRQSRREPLRASRISSVIGLATPVDSAATWAYRAAQGCPRGWPRRSTWVKGLAVDVPALDGAVKIRFEGKIRHAAATDPRGDCPSPDRDR